MSTNKHGQSLAAEKPLFVPLKAEHFEAFERGDKHTEFRLYGAAWHEGTCIIGRRAVLAYGYTKRRLYGVVTSFDLLKMRDLSRDDRRKFKACFGDRLQSRAHFAPLRVAAIGIDISRPQMPKFKRASVGKCVGFMSLCSRWQLISDTPKRWRLNDMRLNIMRDAGTFTQCRETLRQIINAEHKLRTTGELPKP